MSDKITQSLWSTGLTFFFFIDLILFREYKKKKKKSAVHEKYN